MTMNICQELYPLMEIKPFWESFMPLRPALYRTNSQMEHFVYVQLMDDIGFWL